LVDLDGREVVMARIMGFGEMADDDERMLQNSGSGPHEDAHSMNEHQQHRDNVEQALHRRRMSELRGEIDNIIHELDQVQGVDLQANHLAGQPKRASSRPVSASNKRRVHYRRDTREEQPASVESVGFSHRFSQMYAPQSSRNRSRGSTSRKRPTNAHTVISSARTGGTIRGATRPSSAVRRATVSGPNDAPSYSRIRSSRPSSARPVLEGGKNYRSASDFGTSPFRDTSKTSRKRKSLVRENLKAAQRVYGNTKMLENILTKKTSRARPFSAQRRKKPSTVRSSSSQRRNGITRSQSARRQRKTGNMQNHGKLGSSTTRDAWIDLFESEMERTKLLFPVQAELFSAVQHESTTTSKRPQSASNHRYHQRELSPDNLLDTLSNRLDALQRDMAYEISDYDENNINTNETQNQLLNVHIIGGKNLPSPHGTSIKLAVQSAHHPGGFQTFCTQFQRDTKAPFWGEVFGVECSLEDYLIITCINQDGTFVDEISIPVKSIEYDVEQEFAMEDDESDDASLTLMFSRTNSVPVLQPAQNPENSNVKVVQGLPSEESPHKHQMHEPQAPVEKLKRDHEQDDEQVEFVVQTAHTEARELLVPPLTLHAQQPRLLTPRDVPDTPQVLLSHPIPISIDSDDAASEEDPLEPQFIVEADESNVRENDEPEMEPAPQLDNDASEDDVERMKESDATGTVEVPRPKPTNNEPTTEENQQEHEEESSSMDEQASHRENKSIEPESTQNLNNGDGNSDYDEFALSDEPVPENTQADTTGDFFGDDLSHISPDILGMDDDMELSPTSEASGFSM